MKPCNGFRARMRCLCAFQVEIISPLGVGARADQDELGVVDIEQANVLARKAAIAKLFLQFLRVLGLLGFGQAYASRTRRFRVLDRERETRLRRDVESLLHLADLLGKLQRVVEMHLRVLECNGVRAFAGGPGCRAMALATRFRHIRGPAQLACESFCGIGHSVDEAPESLVLADIGKPLTAHGEKTQFLASFRPEDNEEPLDVGKARWMLFLYARPI